jgi:acetoin:2,6-dichlorophenolindophenol oxidoreductase subunit alpha
LRPGDTVAPSGTRWISSRLPDGPLAQMMSELFPEQGEETVLNAIPDPSMSSAQAAIATGLALGYQRQNAGGVVVVLSDRTLLADAATSEALAFAGNRKLPIIYVVEKNLWEGLNSVTARGSDDELRVRALQYGFPVIPVDGNDAIAVYRVAQEALARARKNGGPTLVECRTFRWFGHPKLDPAELRPAAETTQCNTKDPILHMKNHLIKKGLWLE